MRSVQHGDAGLQSGVTDAWNGRGLRLYPFIFLLGLYCILSVISVGYISSFGTLLHFPIHSSTSAVVLLLL